MAVMYDMATDWTFDLFVEDCNTYTGTAIKGVYRNTGSDRGDFMVWLKNCVRDFKANWAKTCAHDYDNQYGYIGDAFAKELPDMYFSDYYKDVYGQRPHLDKWYYIHALGLPMSVDSLRMFFENPLDCAINSAKYVRESITC